LTKIPHFREPQQDFYGSPCQKGLKLAEWMLTISPQLQAATHKDGCENHHTQGNSALSCGVSGHARERNNPLKKYGCYVDLVIPNGLGVCAETLREYVLNLRRPDLLRDVSADLTKNVEFRPKTNSDRNRWQDHARGKCYICKVAVQGRRQEKWPICEDCAALNCSKCEETADLTGKVALVTGGRTKIGRECVLRLLRNGATVLATSRFPQIALERYRQEADFERFHKRLLVFGADFQNMKSVQLLLDEVVRRFEHLDILIHNAAQTIRRPPAYYENFIKRETALALQSEDKCHGCLCDYRDADPDQTPNPDQAETSASLGLVQEALASLPVPANLLSLIPMPAKPAPRLDSDYEAEIRKAEWFPVGKTDAHGEQLDLEPLRAICAMIPSSPAQLTLDGSAGCSLSQARAKTSALPCLNRTARPGFWIQFSLVCGLWGPFAARPREFCIRTFGCPHGKMGASRSHNSKKILSV